MPAAAYSIDVDNNTLRTDDSADALLFPFYSTRVGFKGDPTTVDSLFGARSSFSITNTDPSASIAVKVRFREQITSQEIFDFIVFLSPNDKFDFAVRQEKCDDTTNTTCNFGDPTEPPRIYFMRNRDVSSGALINPSETSCIAPISLYDWDTSTNSAANLFKKPLHTSLTGVDLWKSMSVGHVEVIAMADLTNATYDPSSVTSIPVAPMIIHDPNTGLPGNCALLATIFNTPAGVQLINGEADAPDSLIGRMLVTIPEEGVEAGTNAQSLKDTFTAAQLAAQSQATCASSQNANCTSSYAWDASEWSHPHLGDIGANGFNIDEQAEALALQNDWSRTPLTFVGVDWVTSFPTKYVYMDYLNCDFNVATKEWCYVGGYQGGGNTTPTFNPFGPIDYPVGCLPAFLQVWDWDEVPNNAVSGSNFPEICNEVTVSTIFESTSEPMMSLIQYDIDRLELEFENLDHLRGWADLAFDWFNYVPGQVSNFGAATFGLAMTVRATGDPTANNGSFTDLSRRVNDL
jgi:hypothetical protein